MPRNPNKTDYTQSFPEGFDSFNELSDPRTGGHTKHHFGEVLFIAFTAILCGMKSYPMIENFGDVNKKWFQSKVSLPAGIPSHRTFARVLEALDPVAFSKCIINQVQGLLQGRDLDQIAIDSKALRGSSTEEKSNLHAVSAWACGIGLTLGQTFVEEKSNEITVIPLLLEMLTLKNTVVTIDAMGTQKVIAAKIIDDGGDYILSVKGNQGGLMKELHDYFIYHAKGSKSNYLSSKQWEKYEQDEMNRGRHELRTTIVCENVSWMNSEIRASWKNVKSVVIVQRKVKRKGEDWTTETHYYISSLQGVSAEEIHRYVRSHWEIENSCHWTLDTLFKEDHNQTGQRNAAKNLSTMRRVALNILNQAESWSERKNGQTLIAKQMRACNSDKYREYVLSLVS